MHNENNNLTNEKVNILGVLFDNTTMKDMVNNVKTFFTKETDKNLFIVTANPEIVDYATEHEHYLKLINKAEYVVADGSGVIMASKYLRQPLKERVPGIDLMENCLKIADAEQQKVFLLGATDEVVREAFNNLHLKYQNINFNWHHGYVDLDDARIVEYIKDFDPDYIFVGMGYPKQELWIKKYGKHFKQTVMIGVGGSLDIFSQKIKRAPKFFQKLNIEWVYRILSDWKRIGRTKSIPKFVFKVLKSKRNKA